MPELKQGSSVELDNGRKLIQLAHDNYVETARKSRPLSNMPIAKLLLFRVI